ncbi:hypothetical protein K2173_011207 [Erythroxylum novogranatense]|uniref:Bifunctional inhibitor/plant lipid transfer protein/seed storage helical domain-containing protein n=1 Tax=Erythroxylum novogranatense TaxID=1862640 RepID=A0AAV8TT17_9ROSI|nr:hypothetical protein K2173_011207 [Erythroxylum novogranatense]
MLSQTLNLAIPSIFVLMMLIGMASSDVKQDRAECADKLVSLYTCITYVSGQAKAPTMDCCNGLKQVLDKSKKCLCILIRDRDDPSLGLKINGTLAATLPSICHASANVTKCIESPSGPAKIINHSQNIMTGRDINGSRPSGEEKSCGEKAKGKIGLEMVCEDIIWSFSLHLLVNWFLHM